MPYVGAGCGVRVFVCVCKLDVLCMHDAWPRVYVCGVSLWSIMCSAMDEGYNLPTYRPYTLKEDDRQEVSSYSLYLLFFLCFLRQGLQAGLEHIT